MPSSFSSLLHLSCTRKNSLHFVSWPSYTFSMFVLTVGCKRHHTKLSEAFQSLKFTHRITVHFFNFRCQGHCNDLHPSRSGSRTLKNVKVIRSKVSSCQEEGEVVLVSLKVAKYKWWFTFTHTEQECTRTHVSPIKAGQYRKTDNRQRMKKND